MSTPAVGNVADLRLTMRRHWIDAYLARRVGEWPGSLTILDVGGHRKQRRGSFDIDRFPHRVVTLNISCARSPHICADAGALPFASRTFDAVICAETLEHVYDPQGVLREIARVVRPNARVLLTVPFMVGIHADPEDYGRYTRGFWTRSLVDCGYDLVEIEEHGQLGSVVLDMARSWFMARRSRTAGPRPLLFLLELALRHCRTRIAATEAHGALGRLPASPYTTGYGISARRRGDAKRPHPL